MNKRLKTYLMAAVCTAFILTLSDVALGNESGPTYLEIVLTAFVIAWVNDKDEEKEQ